MTIWLLAFILLASLAAVGYAQGAIRVTFSLVGIVLGALLAMPLARFGKMILVPLGVSNPVLLWILAPLLVFVLFQVIFKVSGLAVHKKVEVYYKYTAGDLRLSLFERLNHRLGACLGLVNGAAYLVLIAMVLYPISYFTTQMSGSDQDSRWVRLSNQFGRDLVSTGMARVAVAIDPVPGLVYQAVDILGLLYNDARVQGRLARYPLFMHLAEEQQFQQIGTDRSFTEMFLRHEPLGTIYNHPSIQAMVGDLALQQRLWDMASPNFQDLRTYLETGKSPKYGPLTILGHWSADAHGTGLALKRNNQDLTTAQMKMLRLLYFPAIEKARLVAYPDNKVVIKGYVKLNLKAKVPVLTANTAPTTAAPVAAAPVARPMPGRYASPGGRYAPARPVAPAAPVAAAPVAGTTPAVSPGGGMVSEPMDLDGSWELADGKYKLTFGQGMTWEGVVEGDRITLTGDGPTLLFERD